MAMAALGQKGRVSGRELGARRKLCKRAGSGLRAVRADHLNAQEATPPSPVAILRHGTREESKGNAEPREAPAVMANELDQGAPRTVAERHALETLNRPEAAKQIDVVEAKRGKEKGLVYYLATRATGLATAVTALLALRQSSEPQGIQLSRLQEEATLWLYRLQKRGNALLAIGLAVAAVVTTEFVAHVPLVRIFVPPLLETVGASMILLKAAEYGKFGTGRAKEDLQSVTTLLETSFPFLLSPDDLKPKKLEEDLAARSEGE